MLELQRKPLSLKNCRSSSAVWGFQGFPTERLPRPQLRGDEEDRAHGHAKASAVGSPILGFLFNTKTPVFSNRKPFDGCKVPAPLSLCVGIFLVDGFP